MNILKFKSTSEYEPECESEIDMEQIALLGQQQIVQMPVTDTKDIRNDTIAGAAFDKVVQDRLQFGTSSNMVSNPSHLLERNGK